METNKINKLIGFLPFVTNFIHVTSCIDCFFQFASLVLLPKQRFSTLHHSYRGDLISLKPTQTEQISTKELLIKIWEVHFIFGVLKHSLLCEIVLFWVTLVYIHEFLFTFQSFFAHFSKRHRVQIWTYFFDGPAPKQTL